MWKTTNYKGETVTWYSEEEYTILEQENQEATEIIAELEWKCKKLINELEEVRGQYEEKKDEKE